MDIYDTPRTADPIGSLLSPAMDVTAVDVIARARQFMTSRAHQLVTQLNESEDRHEIAHSATALLSASLEELKVAEEELRMQNQHLHAGRAEDEQRWRYYRAVFRQLPAAALVTDVRGTILDANAQASVMLGREVRHLERKPLAAMIDRPMREAFRQQLNRAADVDEPLRWSLVIRRTTDVPFRAQATTTLLRDHGPQGACALCWLFDNDR